MAASSVTRLSVAFHLPWQSSLHDAVCNDQATVIEQMDAAALRASQAGDHASTAALSAHVLAYMLADWGRFTGWQMWVARFDAANLALPELAESMDTELSLARATGALACALLRQDTAELQTALGLRVQSLWRTANSAENAAHMALAAGVLLPWLQMARGVTDAQVLHARMTDVWRAGLRTMPLRNICPGCGLRRGRSICISAIRRACPMRWPRCAIKSLPAHLRGCTFAPRASQQKPQFMRRMMRSLMPRFTTCWPRFGPSGRWIG